MDKIEIFRVELRIGKNKIALSLEEAKELYRILAGTFGNSYISWAYPQQVYYTPTVSNWSSDSLPWITTCENSTLVIDNNCETIPTM